MSKLTLSEQNARARTKPCEVPGCRKSRRNVSRFCYAHENGKVRHGHATARHIKVRELNRYAKEIDAFLKTNDGHPVLDAIVVELQGLLDRNAAYEPPQRRLRRFDCSVRTSFELRRLQQAGVTGRNIFRMCALVYRYSVENEYVLPLLSIQHRFALARHVLNLAPRFARRTSSGKRASKRLSTQVLASLGKTLMVLTRPVLYELNESLVKAATAERDRAIRITADLASHPFTT